MGGYGAAAVSPCRVIGDNAVLEGRAAEVTVDAASAASAISAQGTVVDRKCTSVVDTPATATAARSAVCAIPAEGTIADC